MLLEHVEGKLVLAVDDPHEDETILLDVAQWYVLDAIVSQRSVCDGDTSRWIGRRQLPWRVHADDVKESATMFHLLLAKPLEVKICDVGEEWNAVELAGRFDPLDHGHLFILEVDISGKRLEEFFIVLCIAIFLHQELLLEGKDVSAYLDQHRLDALLVVG